MSSSTQITNGENTLHTTNSNDPHLSPSSIPATTGDPGDHTLLQASGSPSPSVAPASSTNSKKPILRAGNGNNSTASTASTPYSLSEAQLAGATEANFGSRVDPYNGTAGVHEEQAIDERPASSFAARYIWPMVAWIKGDVLRPKGFDPEFDGPLRASFKGSSSTKLAHPPPVWVIPRYRGRKPLLRTTILRPLARFGCMAVILGCIVAFTILYSYRPNQPQLMNYGAIQEFNWTPIDPRSYLKPMNASFGEQYDVLLDGHSHTIYSDGIMTPETLLKWHIANGYNAVIVSDHNTIEGGLEAEKIALEKYADKITVIPAMELSCCRFHMNLIGINETIDVAMTKWPTDEQIKAAIQRTHELGGIAIVNHIPWSNATEYGYQAPRLPRHPSREQFLEWGIDGFEIANSATLDMASWKFVQDNNLLVMSGNDIHYPDTSAYTWTIVNTNGNRTKEGIMAQLKARRASFLFDPAGTRYLSYPVENPAYYRAAPPTLLGQYFQMYWVSKTGMYSFSPEGGYCHESELWFRWPLIGWFIAWVLAGYFIFEAARMVIVGCFWGLCMRRRKFLRRRRLRQSPMAGSETLQPSPLPVDSNDRLV
ncbi:hypothetical protein BGW41_000122 [Actinomortierella wolfii]|nr:hypothetical protein BGW41_000122 [Actinomortierella wolfii]